MAAFKKVEFIGGISWHHIWSYFTGTTSLFRQYQTRLLEQYSQEFTGTVAELGCEKSYDHKRFFPHINYICTNIGREFDEYLDITNMKDVPDNSADGYICISVLEHVPDFQAALREIHRSLKIGGRLLLTVPFGFPQHDEVDYWRFSQDMFANSFPEYDIISFIHLGSKFSVIVDELQKPKRKLSGRHILYKLLGLEVALIGKFLDTRDNFPSGYAIYAVKKS